MNPEQQSTLQKFFTDHSCETSVTRLAPVMGSHINIQMKYPVQVCRLNENGGMQPTDEYIRNFIGVIQPSQIPDRVVIAVLEFGYGILAKPEDIEAMYVVLQAPPKEQKSRIIV